MGGAQVLHPLDPNDEVTKNSPLILRVPTLGQNLQFFPHPLPTPLHLELCQPSFFSWPLAAMLWPPACRWMGGVCFGVSSSWVTYFCSISLWRTYILVSLSLVWDTRTAVLFYPNPLAQTARGARLADCS